MGEIMRWRVARSAQRRIAKPADTFHLPSPYQFDRNLQEGNPAAIHAAIATHSGILSDLGALRRYLSSGIATGALPESASLNAGVIQVFVALFQLDQWLVATAPVPPAIPPFTTPAISDLDNELAALRLNSSAGEWQTLRQVLSDLYYLALLFSVVDVSFSLTEALGVLTRWLLVMGLVEARQQNPSPIQTPDDINSALRWRTLILPDVVIAALLLIRAQQKAVLVRKPGFADLYVTREEWDHYEAAEIASIENILAGEMKNRIHVLVDQTQVTTTLEQVTTQVKEQDSTTTDLSQLQQQSSSDISIAAHIDGQVDTSGQYGPTTVNTHLGGSLDFSSQSATSKATTQSHETVSRAVSKIVQTTRQVRTVSTLTRTTDKEEHKFDNAKGDSPIVGVYRWVDQIQNVELDRYPNRFLMEFEIPEPGAWTRWMQAQNAGQNMINQPPVPFTVDGGPVTAQNPMIQAKDLSIDPTDRYFYGKYVARYAVPGVNPPPGPLTIAVNLGSTQHAGPALRFLVANASDTTFTPPAGYKVLVSDDPNIPSWTASLMYATGGFLPKDGLTEVHIDLAVGGGPPARSADIKANPSGTAIQTSGGVYRDHISGKCGPISQQSIPIALQGTNLTGFEVNVEVSCVPLEQTVQAWQNGTYDAILAAYYALQQAYNQEKAGLTIQQQNPVDAYSPDQNAVTIKQELKRQVIEMLTGFPFTGRGALNPPGPNGPTTDLNKAAQVAPEIQFLEQAFEWETLSYICYPYYWADVSRWKDLASINGNDSVFADFLRAGSARVVLAARPGFEAQVNLYVYCGVLWGGGPMPAPNDENYLSTADEIKAMQVGPIDVTVIDTWQVRLPTTLIWLENKVKLPKNENPTIDTKPRIRSLRPGSGKPGDSVTLAGRNFGDIAGSSTVSFNGKDADWNKWASTSLTVTVPAGATTGPVVVTVNQVGSNSMNFQVT